jgi:hypothetical protein
MTNLDVALVEETRLLRDLLAEIEEPLVRIDGQVTAIVVKFDGSFPSIGQ